MLAAPFAELAWSGHSATVGAAKLLLLRQTQSHVKNERQIAEQKKETRHLHHLSLYSTTRVAGTETRLVILSSVGCENSRPDPILLRVQKQKEDDVCYLLDRRVPLGALMADYCSRRGLPYDAVRFTYEGTRVLEAKSAEDVGMDDEDVIDAWADQLGG